MKYFLSVIALFIAPFFLAAQGSEYQEHDFDFQRAGVVYPIKIKQDWFPMIQALEMSSHGPREGKPATVVNPIGRKKVSKTSSEAPVPTIKSSFKGNNYNGRVPNDNDMAISNDGYIVSVINSVIHFYDGNEDTLMLSVSLAAFADTLNLPHSKFDPKVLYDPMEDRFIMAFLNGNLDTTSRLILAFSTTNNPLDAWNLYNIPGNPILNNTWGDYPVVGMSTDDFFVGLNTFTNGSQNNSGFHEATLWAFNKNFGYTGGSVKSKYFSGLNNSGDPFFNICPIQGGSELYGPNMYFLTNQGLDSNGSNKFFLLEMSNSVGNSPVMTKRTLTSNINYRRPPDARQIIVSNPFDTFQHILDANDARVLTGFKEGNMIQFGLNTRDPETGLVGIYHGILEDATASTPKLTGYIIGDNHLDIAFPNITYAGTEDGDVGSVVTFNYTAPDSFAGFGYIYYSNNREYTPVQIVKTGETYVNVISGVNERWGDYTGAQRKYNEPGVVWAAGSFGKIIPGTPSPSRVTETWIVELNSTDTVRQVVDSLPETSLPYPNPAETTLNFKFESSVDAQVDVEIFDLRGRKVDHILRAPVKVGDNLLSFSVASLSKGMYVVIVRDKDEILFKEKFIKQ